MKEIISRIEIGPNVIIDLDGLKNKKIPSLSSKEPSRFKTVSSREKEVLLWLHQGKTSWEIARILGLSERTVNFHVYNIMKKLEAVNRPQMITLALQIGLIDLK